MNLCIFEDEGFANLLPLAYTRPTYELRCGVFTIREKIQRLFPDSPVTLLCRDYLAGAVLEANPAVKVNELEYDDYLFVNGRAILDSASLSSINLEREGIYIQADNVVIAVLKAGSLKSIRKRIGEALSSDDFSVVAKFSIKATLLDYPWDFVHHNSDQIREDFKTLNSPGVIEGKIYPRVSLIEKQNISIARNTSIKSGTVLDAEAGPIVVGQGTEIFPNCTIIGPAFVGENCKIKGGAKIYEGTSIGEFCKVGGEVEESVFHSYSNKQHDGFLGHSYLGQWINLGADTNNSDLKNNYGNVKVQIGDKMINTGSQFVGAMIGDHAKTGINCMLNTGTVIGPFANVFGAGFPPKYIPAFSWGGFDGFEVYNFEKAMDTADRVMRRRAKELSISLSEMYNSLFEVTRPERTRYEDH